MAKTVLVVDDSPTMRQMVAFTLTSAGYQVVEAGNGKEAVGKVNGGAKPDLVVTDLNMPEMDGRTLAETLRRIRPELRVLFVSGYTETAVVHPSERDDRTAFLAKPFTPEGLARSVRRLLSGG